MSFDILKAIIIVVCVCVCVCVNCIVYSLETFLAISIALRQFTRMNFLITPNTETTERTEWMSIQQSKSYLNTRCMVQDTTR